MINQKPTILHAIDTTGPGGAETVFLDLAQHLAIEGYGTIAIIKGPGWVEDQLKSRNIPYLIVRPEGFLSLKYYWRLFQILRKQQVALIQAHLLGSTLTYSLLSFIRRVPLVATIHGKVDVNPNERRVYLKNRIMRAGVDRLVAVSEDLAQYIEQRRLFHKDAIRIIYNGIQVDRYRRTTQQAIKQSLHLPRDAILIGSLGNVRPAKAYDVLISAAKSVIAHNPKVHFVIAGHLKAKLMEELNRQMEAINVQSNVHFIGFHSDTAEFLGQLDYFALSSSSEGFSIATIEAMATGLPIIATRCGGPEEIIRHNETGYLVNTNSPEELAGAIMTLIEDPETGERWASAAKEAVRNVFSLEKSLQEYRLIYQSLLHSPRSRLSSRQTEPSDVIADQRNR